ncbi:hypothetical protein M6D81_24385 [Paenibacillus sp. J5C_2022]|uniref:hypothetical protein n=1 Tax=Paenibacillus sp. J5C2022 TaxID=2977129 RepID=UPI0021CE0BCA|nr:hypothetical protein [Paenibacillus sp. J5C2022]MCU6711843.1 hypothetical protein [Paenibacillus sp. J5C2022]
MAIEKNDLELLIHSIRFGAAGTTYRFGASNIFSKLQVVAKLFINNNYHDQDIVFAKTENNKGYPELIKMVHNRMRRLQARWS